MSRRTKTAKLLPKTGGRGAAELPGVVLPQLVRCGKPTCRCASREHSDLHGPYYYRFWWDRGRLCKTYVPRADLASVSAACARRQERERRGREGIAEIHALLQQFKATMRDLETHMAEARR